MSTARLIWIILGTVALCIVLLLAIIAFNLVWHTAKPTLTLIPDGYVGPVVILFGREDGVAAKYERGIRVFEIPSSGILKEQIWPSNGAVRYVDDDQYFYVKSDGSRVRIPVYMRWTENYRSKMSENELTSISIYAIEYGNAPRKDGSGTNYFVDFLVGKLQDVDMLIKKRSAIPYESL